ncbi:protein rolling stone-like [Physella acuta]|uniref:protein rolling stone-like n=1 Tax=Physella acuta TaxID=109671 RepID=UPI0027DBA9CA|nr:protein rolling stone-like [Physella acuta]
MSFREEFSFRKFGFQDIAIERFCIFQWRAPGAIYVFYRLVLAVYTNVWLTLKAINPNVDTYFPLPWGAYLTNWTYILLTIYFTVHAIVTIVVYAICRGSGLPFLHRRCSVDHWRLFHEVNQSAGYEIISGQEEQRESVYTIRNSIPWYMGLVWLLFSAASVATINDTFVFWAILVPGSKFGTLNTDNEQMHLVNCVLVALEHAVTAIPIRLLHVIYPIMYGFVYVFFSIFYWVDNHDHVMYPILEWGNLGPTIGYVFLIGFVIIPVVHICFYILYRLKIALFRCCCQESA